jgi:hypothetical protein
MKKKLILKIGRIYWVHYGPHIYRARLAQIKENCWYKFVGIKDFNGKAMVTFLNKRMLDQCVFKTEKEANESKN